MILFCSARKLSSYLVRAKLYPTERTAGSYKSVVENFLNFNEASTFTSIVTGETCKINHSIDCNERCLVYLLTCINCKTQYVGQTHA